MSILSTPQAEIAHLRSKGTSAADLVNDALPYLRAAVQVEECEVCRESYRQLAAVAEGTVFAGRFSDHLRRHRSLSELQTKVVELGERIGAWSFLGRLTLKVRGAP